MRTAALANPEPETGSGFGFGVALDGDRLAVATLNGFAGRTYLYTWTGEAWVGDGILDAPPLRKGSFTTLIYGADMALDGDVLVVTEPGRADGTVYVYRRGSEWSLEATLQRSRNELGPLATFGMRADVSGDRILASAAGRDYQGSNRGAAFVYARTADGTWEEEAELRPRSAVDGFARDVAIDGDVALVGRNDAEAGRGGAFVFERSGDNEWRERR